MIKAWAILLNNNDIVYPLYRTKKEAIYDFPNSDGNAISKIEIKILFDQPIHSIH